MLTKKQVLEIREHLEKAQNPIFLFDNDPDGLCSFLLLRRYIGRGEGVPIKSFPDISPSYLKKVKDFKSDYVFILDKPVVSGLFFNRLYEMNVPIVWIDHHIIDRKKIPSFVNYYNPLFNKKKGEEPVTALCFQISDKKEDLWIAAIGCISDSFLPKFYSRVEEIYPELTISSQNVLNILYKSQLGKIAKIFNYALKDKTSNVNKMIRFLINAKSPWDVLNENEHNHTLHKRFKEVLAKYSKLLSKAISIGKKSGKVLFFVYKGKLSVSGDLANELKYIYPEKIIVVIYVKGLKANISMRGERVINIFSKAIIDLKGADGGGHKDAVGGHMNLKDLERFKENVLNVVNKS
ncbi:MAG: DHH family phosphoesterase [Candidatus Pacearchaeota archaeon]